MKGTQERGLILGSVEEIVLILDDNAMNLQSMSSSRFVGPFLDRVQKWEKSLSHISEVVDVSRLHSISALADVNGTCSFSCVQVWMVVQRKWMYLESIFIGGDIRSQLPEEAKKFDKIDKTFRKVWHTYKQLSNILN